MSDDKVLVVDDEREFTELLAKRMRKNGLRVSTAKNGLEAIDQIKKESFDAIILDMVMPEMDGLETLKRLRKIKPDLQVILLSGHATLDAGVEAIKLGALDFMEKPMDFKKLLEKIGEAKKKRMVLIGKKMDKKIEDILETKGW